VNISKRILGMQFSPIRKLVPYGDAAKARGIKVYHLNIGQPDIKTPECFFDALKSYNKKTVAYTNSQGVNPLIESFIKYYRSWNINFDEDEIMITAGGSEALMFAMMAICDEGEEVIIPEPFYTNYNSFGDIASVKVVPFLTKAEEGFHLPGREKIESMVNEKTRANSYQILVTQLELFTPMMK
jgi:aspartate aminotransferase